MLEDLNQELAKLKIQLHLSEIKGPVMDHLYDSHLIRDLTGQIYLTHYQAMCELNQSSPI